MEFLHGIEVIENNSGTRPIRTTKSSVIGLIGTAPDAGDVMFPYHKPVLIAGSRKESAKLGSKGTLPGVIDAIFNQIGAQVVVVRVKQENKIADTINNIIGGVDSVNGQYKGVHAFLGAASIVHAAPKILIAPGFTHIALPSDTDKKAASSVITELIPIAQRLKAIIIADGPNTTDEAAINFRKNFGSDRLFIADPWVSVLKDGETIEVPASGHIAGLVAKIDDEKGFWHSPSNNIINGIVGTSRAIDFTLGDKNARANYLNENEITTIIHQNGYRLWGNRTTSDDPKWAFLSVRRTADMINDSILKAHLWAVDRNIGKTYVEDVTESVNGYIRNLISQGAVLSGKCYADKELNTSSNIMQGKIYFNVEFSPPSPAEHITFTSTIIEGGIL